MVAAVVDVAVVVMAAAAASSVASAEHSCYAQLYVCVSSSAFTVHALSITRCVVSLAVVTRTC